VKDGYRSSTTDLEHCHPSYAVSGNVLQTQSCSHADYYTDLDNTGSITAASQIACKMLSSARVAQQLNASVAEGISCSKGNQLAVAIAEKLAAPSTLARFKKAGKGWCFDADSPTVGNIGPVWLLRSLSLSENATCMAVSSPVLTTGLDSSIYPGSHYCKFLSPARVLDWMMTDSLKHASSEASVGQIIV